jgi:Helix-turn-helix domain
MAWCGSSSTRNSRRRHKLVSAWIAILLREDGTNAWVRPPGSALSLKSYDRSSRMPWEEVTRVSLREEFVQLAIQTGVDRRELCRRFGISPKTGYKWLRRYRSAGSDGLQDGSRRPHRSPSRARGDCVRKCCACGWNRATVGVGASCPASWPTTAVRDCRPAPLITSCGVAA